LKNSGSNKIKSHPLPLPCHAAMIEGEGENVLYCYIENTSDCKERHVSHSSPAVSRSIAGCFTQQNIGEVSHSDGGVEKTAAVTKSNLTLLPCRTP